MRPLCKAGISSIGSRRHRSLNVAPSSRVLDRLASGALRLPPGKCHPLQNIADALREANGAPGEGKPLLDFSDWASD